MSIWPHSWLRLLRLIGRDRIIVNAPGHGPDSLVVDAGPGTIAVAGLPGARDIGEDSAAVRIVAKDPTGTHSARALNAAFTLGGGANLRFSDGSSAITSIAIADGDSITAPFYVVATAGGRGDVLITSPDYVDFAHSIIVAGQPLVLRPDAGIVVAGWVFRQDITAATPMGTDVVVSATSLNHLTLQ